MRCNLGQFPGKSWQTPRLGQYERMNWKILGRPIVLLLLWSLPLGLRAAEKEEKAKEGKADLPSAQEILERFSKELGGKEAFEKHSSQQGKGTIEMLGQQVKGTMEIFAARPNKLKMVVNMESLGEFTTGFDGKVGWLNSQLTGPMLLTGKQLDDVATQADFDHTLHNPADYKVMEVVGREEFNGEDCYKLNLVHRTGYKSTEFFSTKSGLQKGFTATQESPLGPVTSTTIVNEYKKFGDLTMPAKITQKVGGMETTTIITEMQYDKVDPSVFDIPAQVKPLLEKPASTSEKNGEDATDKKTEKKQ